MPIQYDVLDREPMHIRVLDALGKISLLRKINFFSWMSKLRKQSSEGEEKLNGSGWGQQAGLIAIRMIEVYWRHEADYVLHRLRELASQINDTGWRRRYATSDEFNKLKQSLDSFVFDYLGHNLIGFTIPLHSTSLLDSMELRLESDSPYSFRMEMSFYPSDSCRYAIWQICSCQMPAKLGPISWNPFSGKRAGKGIL